MACLILPQAASPAALQRAAEVIAPIAQARGVALLLANDTRIATRVRADGVHIDRGLDDLRLALESFRPDRIVGAGGVSSRHEALAVGELEPDYVFFGQLDGDGDDFADPAMIVLAAWWSEVVVVPGMLMGGRTLASIEDCAATGVEFVALGRAIWEDPRGPKAAVIEANRHLTPVAGRAA